ncbi:hypothetical protein [Bradyrhizobium sp. HKCCYLS20291]|uniref:hypothetical protein n=1 Tax=Bradyrhizobium sp. HKCCYLS20291 TaxID=3420766 RepID=UPI003EBBB3A3
MIPRKRVRIAFIGIGLLTGMAMADAAAPISLDGWRHSTEPDDVHVFLCQRADCVFGSWVSCRTEPLDAAVPPWARRKDDSTAATVASEGDKPAMVSPPLNLNLIGRSYWIETADDGTSTYRTSSIVHDATSTFVLTSSSSDRNASWANLDRFESALQKTK